MHELRAERLCLQFSLFLAAYACACMIATLCSGLLTRGPPNPGKKGGGDFVFLLEQKLEKMLQEGGMGYLACQLMEPYLVYSLYLSNDFVFSGSQS